MTNAKRNGVTDAQIIEHYKKSNSSNKTAKHFGIDQKTVLRVLTIHGVERNGDRNRKLAITKFIGQETELYALYQQGWTMKQLTDKFGGSTDSIKTAFKRIGGQLREPIAKPETVIDVSMIQEMRLAGKSLAQISIAINRSESFVAKVVRRLGLPAKKFSKQSHPMWKGGRYVDKGYVRVRVEPSSPLYVMTDTSGYAAEHRIVMAEAIGRALTSHETVHHINGDTTDNRIENLQLRFGRHGKGVVMCCKDCGSQKIGYAPIGD